ncbi:ATP-binding protein [Paenarthrobacter sp. NPDC090522]|uniref:HD domain-containing protein n=1 Tax=Paenarthrobacter sp. NPDC090522 TaxID=3364383 RepID=UPI0037F6F58C
MSDLKLPSKTELAAEEAQKYGAFSGLSLRHFRGQIAEALNYFGSFSMLEEYTKHDISHIDGMLAMYDWMIPEETKSKMTPADWLLITLSTYLHDFGLLITRDEFDARENNLKYLEFRSRVLNNDDPSVKDYRSQIERLEGLEADHFMYQEFVRYYHAERIRGWIKVESDLSWGGDARVVKRLGELMRELEETFREDVGIVCESHHLDDLHDTRKYPLSRPYGATPEEEANVQYAAMLLRTSDLLHVTNDRVPSMAALVINPRNPKSQVEWAKQGAVRRVRAKPVVKTPDATDNAGLQDTIEVHASFKEAEGYFGLTGYLQYATKQLQQTFAWSGQNHLTGGSSFEFPWNRIDSSHIEAKGFVTEQFVFEIDQAKILDLLTGHTLYNDTGVVVRELVQNSLDAVRLQAHLMSKTGQSYSPKIVIEWSSPERTLTVTDNGVGMSQSIIEKNFLHVGSSRYQEPEFQKAFPEFASISRFGIGVLSTFMVADDVTVVTVHESEEEARKLSLRDVHGQYLVRLLQKHDNDVPAMVRSHGTSVSMKLRPSAELSEVEAVLRQWIVVPGCEVTVTTDDDAPKQVGYQSVAEALRESLVDANLARLAEGGLVTESGARLEVRTAKISGLEVALAVAWNEWLQDWGYVRLEASRHDYSERHEERFGVCIGGVRVTTQPPGFVFGGIAAMANATGKSAPRTNVARSAIEKTEEYETMLNRIYSAYVGHIATEVHELEVNRASSLTRAAQEASYLMEDLARAEAESTEILDQQLRTVPAIVVEEEGVRKAYSLSELAEYEELASLESNTISSFEAVLRSVRGATSPSLKNLIEAMGSDEILPAAPLVCGLNRYSLIAKMFAAEWEIVRLETDVDGRTLSASWHRKKETPVWLAPGRRSSLPPSLAARLERDFNSGRGTLSRIDRTLFPSDPDSIELVGFSERKLVLCQGWLLLLPGHPLLDIQPTSAEVPDGSVRWCVSWLINQLSGFGRVYSGGWVETSTLDRRGSRWISSVLDSVRSSGIFEILDEESVRQALLQADLDPLDVLRWDRRINVD